MMKMISTVMGTIIKQPPFRPLLALILAFPYGISIRQCDLLIHLLNSLLDRAPQVPSAYTVLDGHVPRIPFPIDFGSSVLSFDFAELRQRNALVRRRQQANAGDSLACVAVLR